VFHSLDGAVVMAQVVLREVLELFLALNGGQLKPTDHAVSGNGISYHLSRSFSFRLALNTDWSSPLQGRRPLLASHMFVKVKSLMKCCSEEMTSEGVGERILNINPWSTP
jgi:hypothetical protein